MQWLHEERAWRRSRTDDAAWSVHSMECLHRNRQPYVVTILNTALQVRLPALPGWGGAARISS